MNTLKKLLVQAAVKSVKIKTGVKAGRGEAM